MPEAVPRPPYATPQDALTPNRDIAHGHFAPGDRVVIIHGVAGDSLYGDAVTVVAPSWHTPTDEDGWRLRNPLGGQHTFVTGHPRYLIHLDRHCPDCLIHMRALEELLLPRLSSADENTEIDCGWYSLTALDQLVHVADAKQGL
ncbi:hypothetical protein ACFRJ1_02530 [Streptomyces sp. NPDC056773]|uniref:hypothetical protein n=1 Tax=unclassified Streptomyces TaxID=2593676 RepID=UPI00367D1334